jgi:hypothetical protein
LPVALALDGRERVIADQHRTLVAFLQRVNATRKPSAD